MRIKIQFIVFLFTASALSVSLLADVRLPSIVSDGMVLQRDQPLKIWGWADPGEKVSVDFVGVKKSAKADVDGKWKMELSPMEAGGPYELQIKGKNLLKLNDVYLGDVWICSGQSNMTHQFNRHQERYQVEIAESENPKIRQFYVPTSPALGGPVEDIPNLSWKPATPENLLNFTVIGYFYAEKLYERYGVPQGIINSCVGGTRIESWTSEEGLKEFPELVATIERNKDQDYIERVNAEAKADRESDGPTVDRDKGRLAPVPWQDPAYEPLNWKPYTIPGYWEDHGMRNLDGVVWFRREVEVPESMIGMDVTLKLGRIRNADEAYVNGQRVGSWGYEYPQRDYTIPAGVLKPGKNLFVIRVQNNYGKGGFIVDKPYYIEAGGDRIDLKGDWLYKVGEVFRPARKYKSGISAQGQPASLYNGMIAPFVEYGIRGILWYQGESNANDPEEYRTLLPGLIEDWRAKWGLGDIPFLIAQLPKYMDIDFLPAESNWALMREVQLQTSQTLPNVGLGVNLELGEWNDIHPLNKKPVGERLALQAMEISYDDSDIVSSGPVYDSSEIEDGKIIISFEHVGSGLVSNNKEPLAHFAIAGADKKFVWAEAEIEGDSVIVWSNEVADPKYVRYAWADNPDFANLYNKEGLPASPFRTDK